MSRPLDHMPSSGREPLYGRGPAIRPATSSATPTETRPSSLDARPAAPTPAKPPVDSLKTVMPAGELGSRNDPSTVLASRSGGTSKAEDTSRAAGYVADLTQENVAPPGPPITKSAENFEGLDGATDPAQHEAKSGPGPTPPAPPTPDPLDTDASPRPSPNPGTPLKAATSPMADTMAGRCGGPKRLS